MDAQHGTALKHSQLHMNPAIVLPQPGVCLPSSHPSLQRDALQTVCMYYAAGFLSAWFPTPASRKPDVGGIQMAPVAGQEVRLVGLTMADTTEGLCPWLGAMELDTSLIIIARWSEREEIICSAGPDAVESPFCCTQLLVFVFFQKGV